MHKLGERLGMARETILYYLTPLERADIITNLRHAARGVARLDRPDKIFISFTNLLYALPPPAGANGGDGPRNFPLQSARLPNARAAPASP